MYAASQARNRLKLKLSGTILNQSLSDMLLEHKRQQDGILKDLRRSPNMESLWTSEEENDLIVAISKNSIQNVSDKEYIAMHNHTSIDNKEDP